MIDQGSSRNGKKVRPELDLVDQEEWTTVNHNETEGIIKQNKTQY